MKNTIRGRVIEIIKKDGQNLPDVLINGKSIPVFSGDLRKCGPVEKTKIGSRWEEENWMMWGFIGLPKEVGDYLVSEINKIKAEESLKIQQEINKKYQSIPGLKELENARDEIDNYHHQFARMMENEDNDGCQPPVGIKSDLKSLRIQYPKAADYLIAEDYYYSDNYVKSGEGKMAMERIEKGEDSQKVVQEMKDNFLEYCKNAVD